MTNLHISVSKIWPFTKLASRKGIQVTLMNLGVLSVTVLKCSSLKCNTYKFYHRNNLFHLSTINNQ